MQAITDIDSITEIIKKGTIPVEIEIGCGNGHFITEYGESNNKLLIGIDIKNKRCVKTLKKVKNKGLKNICVYRGKAEEFLKFLPSEKIDAFHIYFPDPWPKARHRKRRFFRFPQIDKMSDCLKNKGSIYFATDVFDYYIQAKILMGFHKELIILNTAEPPGELYNSVFGKRFLNNKKNIYFVCAEKIL